MKGLPSIERPLDNTALSAYMACPREYYLSMVLSRRSEGKSAPLAFGGLIHKLLEMHYKTGGAVPLVEAVGEAWWKEHGHHEEGDYRTFERAILDYRRYREKWGQRPEDEQGTTVGYPDEPMVEIAADIMAGGLIHPYAVKLDRIIELGGLHYVEDHKAQPLHAAVLTPEGWSTMGALTVGDYVVGSDGRPAEVLGVYPQGELETYRVIFTDGRSTLCSLEHLWSVTDQMGTAETLTLEEILAAPSWRRFSVPLPAPIDFDEKQLPVHPYLLGCLLGDSYLAGKAVQLSATDPHIVNYVQMIAEDEGPRFEKSGGDWKNNSWNLGVGVKNNSLAKALEKLDLLGTKSESKFLPRSYLRSAVEQRLTLLQGLMDTDGCVHNGVVTYTTVSNKLADDVVELVRSLGGLASRRSLRPVKDRQQAYKIHIRLPEDLCPFTMPRKVKGFDKGSARRRCYIQSIERTQIVEPHVCIIVDAEDNLYITDDFVVTHNTTSRLDKNYYSSFELSNQMQGYTRIGQLLMPSLKIVGVRLNVAHCIKSGTNFERQLFTYTKEQMSEWVENTNEWMVRISRDVEGWPSEAELMSGRARWPLAHFGDNGCSRKYGLCQYHKVCSVAAPFRHRVLAEYPVNVWNPLEVEE